MSLFAHRWPACWLGGAASATWPTYRPVTSRGQTSFSRPLLDMTESFQIQLSRHALHGAHEFFAQRFRAAALGSCDLVPAPPLGPLVGQAPLFLGEPSAELPEQLLAFDFLAGGRSGG